MAEKTTRCLELRLLALKFDTVANKNEIGKAFQIVPQLFFRNGEYGFFIMIINVARSVVTVSCS